VPDSTICTPGVLDLCDSVRPAAMFFGLSKNSPFWRRTILPLEASTAARLPPPSRVRSSAALQKPSPTQPGPGQNPAVSSRVSRVAPEGTDTRYIVHQISRLPRQHLYEKVLIRGARRETHIQAWKAHLAADGRRASKPTPIRCA